MTGRKPPAAKPPSRPPAPPIAGNPEPMRMPSPLAAGDAAPVTDPICYVCGKQRAIMLTVEVRDGVRKVCSPCWRRDYRC